MYCTPVIDSKARKQHKCTNCAEQILIGETYAKWTSFENGCFTNKMHNECLKGLLDNSECGYFEYSPYSGDRQLSTNT